MLSCGYRNSTFRLGFLAINKTLKYQAVIHMAWILPILRYRGLTAGLALARKMTQGNQGDMMKKRRSQMGVKEKGKAGNQLVKVAGIVIPIEWDEDGNPLATTISTPGEREYVVGKDSKGEELLGFVRQEIEVIGVLRTGVKGGNTIRVHSYRPKGARDWQGEAEPEKTMDAPPL